MNTITLVHVFMDVRVSFRGSIFTITHPSGNYDDINSHGYGIPVQNAMVGLQDDSGLVRHDIHLLDAIRHDLISFL